MIAASDFCIRFETALDIKNEEMIYSLTTYLLKRCRTQNIISNRDKRQIKEASGDMDRRKGTLIRLMKPD